MVDRIEINIAFKTRDYSASLSGSRSGYWSGSLRGYRVVVDKEKRRRRRREGIVLKYLKTN